MENLEELTKLLRESINMCREDRKAAKANYEALRKQLDDILERGMESSEDGRVEQEVNKSLKLVFEAAQRADKVIDSITKILVVQLNNESRERVANSLIGGNFPGSKQIVTGPVDIKMLIDED
jgi:hypothetical protein